jgi:co-chaperonin GroES (HSP10)
MIQPVWGRLVVKPNDITETDEILKSGKAAGIYIPESREKDQLQHGQIEGQIVAIGGNCFDDWTAPIPKVGDQVIYDKYAGFIKSIDNEEYRIISDTDVLAIC